MKRCPNHNYTTYCDCPDGICEMSIALHDPIVNSVIEKFKQRSEAGIKKYGTTLNRDDLSRLEWINHLQEELMDAILYCERLKQELHEKHENMY